MGKVNGQFDKSMFNMTVSSFKSALSRNVDDESIVDATEQAILELSKHLEDERLEPIAELMIEAAEQIPEDVSHKDACDAFARILFDELKGRNFLFDDKTPLQKNEKSTFFSSQTEYNETSLSPSNTSTNKF